MNRTEAPQSYRISASGIEGLQTLAAPVTAGPAAVASVSVSLGLPCAAAVALQGQVVPVRFKIMTERVHAGFAAAAAAHVHVRRPLL